MVLQLLPILLEATCIFIVVATVNLCSDYDVLLFGVALALDHLLAEFKSLAVIRCHKRACRTRDFVICLCNLSTWTNYKVCGQITKSHVAAGIYLFHAI